MEHGAWRRRGHVAENGVDSVRLPAKIFLKDNDVYVLALELLRISSISSSITTVMMVLLECK
jgi:hypothetical protein